MLSKPRKFSTWRQYIFFLAGGRKSLHKGINFLFVKAFSFLCSHSTELRPLIRYSCIPLGCLFRPLGTGRRSNGGTRRRVWRWSVHHTTKDQALVQGVTSKELVDVHTHSHTRDAGIKATWTLGNVYKDALILDSLRWWGKLLVIT